MNRFRVSHMLAAMALALGLNTSCLGEDQLIMNDAVGDAVLRRTDPGADGAINPQGVLPDLVRIELAAWSPFDPENDPYTGQVIDPDHADIFRLKLVINGLVNPPGTIGLNGEPYDPFEFGPSPIYGFIDIDADDRKNSGGELGGAALNRILANVARFGELPDGSIAERAALSADDYDDYFYSDPQYERTGAEFTLSLCGCDGLTLRSQIGDGDEEFEADETWVVSGCVFERAQGLNGVCASYGGWTGVFGAYDPYGRLQFKHDSVSSTTTITLVFPLTMRGASLLEGEPEQPADLDVSNHVSIFEALEDLIAGANGGLSGVLEELADDWRGRDAEDNLDPSDWHVTGIVGTTYVTPEASLYAWTDVGFDTTRGDFDANGYLSAADEAMFRQMVYAMDGTSADADGVKDGSVQIVDPGPNFHLADVNGDWVIDVEDQLVWGPLADYTGEGIVNTADVIAYLNAFVAGAPEADFDLNETLNTSDFISYLNAYTSSP